MRLNEYIKRVPGHIGSDGKKREWCIFSHDTHELLQCYPTKVEAEKALERMKSYKHKGKEGGLERVEEIFGAIKKWRDEKQREKVKKRWLKVFGAERYSEVEKWMRYFDDPDKAWEWYRIGFEPREALRWTRVGIHNPREAADWYDLGFEPREAKKWNEVGVTDAFEAVGWVELGMSPKEAVEWVKQGFSPKEAEKWMQVGLSAKEARRWVERGMTVQDAVKYKTGYARGKEFGKVKVVDWKVMLVREIVKRYRNIQDLIEDLELVVYGYGALNKKALVLAFIEDAMKDPKVMKVVGRKVAVKEGDVEEVEKLLREEFARKGIDFDDAVEAALMNVSADERNVVGEGR